MQEVAVGPYDQRAPIARQDHPPDKVSGIRVALDDPLAEIAPAADVLPIDRRVAEQDADPPPGRHGRIRSRTALKNRAVLSLSRAVPPCTASSHARWSADFALLAADIAIMTS